MSHNSWLAINRSRHEPRGTARRWRLQLETLEDRTVPAVFNVNTLLDTVDVNPGNGLAQDAVGNTSLRAAVMEANALAGADTINLPAGTYALTRVGANENGAALGDLDVLDSLTLFGAGRDSTIIAQIDAPISPATASSTTCPANDPNGSM